MADRLGSALDRRQLGKSIESRFDGVVTYYDKPVGASGRVKGRRQQLRATAVLDWATLHPVERLELLTTHDLARKEKQKLELLRGLLTYFHYATRETREEVLREEITGSTRQPTSCVSAFAPSTRHRSTASTTTIPKPR